MTDTEQQTHVIVFCGPNGSGKTTLIDELKASGLTAFGGVYDVPAYFINPDQIAKDLKGDYPDQRARDEAAFQAAVALRDQAIASGKPFAYETVMSHPSRINEMLRLKQQGYTLLVTFITTEHPDKNVARVKQRVETGTTTGHYVPEETVRARYARTLALLPKAAEIADAVFVYDNSVDFKAPTLQAVIDRDGRFDILEVEDGGKEWIVERLVTPLQLREEELAGIEGLYPAASFANELNGTYSGPVQYLSDSFVVQFDELTHQHIVHDRLMLDTASESHQNHPPIYFDDEKITVIYAPAKAPVIEHME
jgi:predicted ABC-type ATPase